jgi:hypothetical protein
LLLCRLADLPSRAAAAVVDVIIVVIYILRAIESSPQSPAWSRPPPGDVPLGSPPPAAAHEAARMLLGVR